MDIVFLCIIVFLLLLAVFDLSVGVSNDAVNFLNSAIGAKAAPLGRIILVAAIGVFIGAAMSNGMMDVARHGIFRPEHFSFYDLVCIFMAVMCIDIVLLDMFNTLGMPTSTTVSLVFELLGATFVVALFKTHGDCAGLGVTDLLNTEKALTIILGIFLSVAIAFFFGTVIQFLTRMLFTFRFTEHLKWTIGVFGGLCSTAIIYFLIIKGIKDLSFMTPDVKAWIHDNTGMLMLYCFVGLSILMQLLHIIGVNVLKVVVLLGTFALAMAFAGNDLVNFIGVPLTGLASFQEFTASGAADAHTFMMGSLNGPANTPIYFLIGAGALMVFTLATSKKARNVTKTQNGLGSQNNTGDEMFGSSRIGRRLVRWTLSGITWVSSHTPPRVRRWIDRRFNMDGVAMEQGQAFDLVRGAVNLVVAGALIALGTSWKLPLSTTFVTFMVAMGTSLADRAWGRESAVFRVTGVISVIGGWFITAGIAFIGAGLVAAFIYWGGLWTIPVVAAIAVVLLIHSNRRYRQRKAEDGGDALFQTILATEDAEQRWPLLLDYISERQSEYLTFARESFDGMTGAFIHEDVHTLERLERTLFHEKDTLKSARRKETLCLRQLTHPTAIEKSTWFHLANNCCMSMLYNLRRINEVCKEHTENNFLPLPQHYVAEFEAIRATADQIFADTLAVISSRDIDAVPPIRRRCDELKDRISDGYHRLHEQLREGDQSTITVLYVYLNMLQETQDLVSNVRKYLRAFAKLCDTDSRITHTRTAMAPAPAGANAAAIPSAAVPDRFATIDQKLL